MHDRIQRKGCIATPSRTRRATTVLAFASVALRLLAHEDAALGYPSAVVFAPTGEVYPQGDVAFTGYGSLALAPKATPGVAWLGAQASLLPRLRYTRGDDSEVNASPSFGGLEAGADLFQSDLAGTGASYRKLLLNIKAQLVTQTTWSPSVAVGAMDVAPFRMERSMNLFYAAATKSLALHDGGSLGRLSAGVGWVGNDFRADPFRASAPTFTGTWPFSTSARLLVFGGYEAPPVGPLSFSIDHVGGLSELSSTNVVMNVALSGHVTWSAGAWLGNDPDIVAAGLFTAATVIVDVAR